MRNGSRLLFLLLFVSLAACGGSPEPGTDAGEIDGGQDAASAACGSDAECSDGLYCNGDEICDPGSTAADANGCRPGTEPCGPAGMCNEVSNSCIDVCEVDRDADADGRENGACGGDDCDDGDANRYPGNTEICDPDDHDEDCDPSTFGFRDADTDGYPDASCCNPSDGGPPVCGDDCDDMRPGSNPDNAEVCNTRDDDCDGIVDEEVQIVLVADTDLDGFGSAAADAATMMGCGPVMGWQVDRVDCDDTEASVHPGATEECNAIDDDCDSMVDDRAGGCACTTGDTQACSTDVGECTVGTQTCTSGVWGSCSGVEPTAESCDGQDDDCDGVIDDGVGITCYPDVDGDGYASVGATAFTDCPDPNPLRAGEPYRGCRAASTGTPPVTALPSPRYDCSDSDAAQGPPRVCYTDGDGDGHGLRGSAPVSSTCSGTCPAGQSLYATDCCDTDAGSRPGAPASTSPNACGSWDRDCDGAVEEAYRTATGYCQPSGSAACLCYSCRGYVGTAPACGDSGDYITGCAGSGVECGETFGTQRQACN